MYKISEITVNGKTYDWRMIGISINIDYGNGSTETYVPSGITSLTYSQTRDSQWNFGVGGRAISKGYGNTQAEASITMAAFELQAIKDKMTGDAVTAGEDSRYIQNIPQFNIDVTYNFDDGTTKVDRLMQCSLNTDSAGASQNDMFIQADINLDPAEVRYGITK